MVRSYFNLVFIVFCYIASTAYLSLRKLFVLSKIDISNQFTNDQNIHTIFNQCLF